MPWHTCDDPHVERMAVPGHLRGVHECVRPVEHDGSHACSCGAVWGRDGRLHQGATPRALTPAAGGS